MKPDFYEAPITEFGCRATLCVVRFKDGRVIPRAEPFVPHISIKRTEITDTEVILVFDKRLVDVKTEDEMNELRKAAGGV